VGCGLWGSIRQILVIWAIKKEKRRRYLLH
jgi:hypothetical protein